MRKDILEIIRKTEYLREVTRDQSLKEELDKAIQALYISLTIASGE